MIFKLVDCSIRYNDEPKGPIRDYLCAIGKYDENDKDCQDWDDQIFYWFENKKELKEFMEFDETAEFTIINYNIR